MQQLLVSLTGLGPYFLAALLLGGGLAALSPWLVRNPHRWLPIVILFLCLAAVGGGGEGSDGSLFKQLTWGSLFAYCGLWLMLTTRDWSELRHSVPLALLLLLALAGLSILWSPVAFVSFKRYAQLVGIVLIGLVLARQASQGRSLHEMLMFSCALMLVLGLTFAALKPESGFDADHALQAFSSHKNTWGQFSLLCCLVFSIGMLTRPKLRWASVMLLLLSMGSLVATKSTTSLLAFVAMVNLTLVWLAIYRGGWPGMLSLILVLGISLLGTHIYLVVNGEFPFERMAEGIYSATGKSKTLTGRTYLWDLVLNEIFRHPVVGIGYGSFWLDSDGPSRTIISQLNWGPPSQAHSGYLDVTNELGILGLSMLLLVLATHLHRIWRLIRLEGKEHALFHGALLFCALIINYAETSFLRTTHLWWILLCASMIDVQARLRRLDSETAGNLKKDRFTEVRA